MKCDESDECEQIQAQFHDYGRILDSQTIHCDLLLDDDVVFTMDLFLCRQKKCKMKCVFWLVTVN